MPCKHLAHIGGAHLCQNPDCLSLLLQEESKTDCCWRRGCEDYEEAQDAVG